MVQYWNPDGSSLSCDGLPGVPGVVPGELQSSKFATLDAIFFYADAVIERGKLSRMDLDRQQ